MKKALNRSGRPQGTPVKRPHGRKVNNPECPTVPKAQPQAGSVVPDGVPTTDWFGMYSSGWGRGDLVPDAFQHPAKAAKKLIFRIVQHALDNGWILPGQTVVDPFGGIGTSALPCLLAGVNVVTCELESRFTGIAEKNRALWTARYAAMPRFKDAQWTILNGDSRHLSSVLAKADVCGVQAACSSPPYAAGTTGHGVNIDFSKAKEGGKRATPARLASGDSYGKSAAQLGEMREGTAPSAAIASPPYTPNEKSDYLMTPDGKTRKRDVKRGYKQGHGCFRGSESYGASSGQLGRMAEGATPVCALSSPPYAAGTVHGRPGIDHAKVRRKGGRNQQANLAGYGDTAGNISAMPEGKPACAISSPPYAEIAAGAGGLNHKPAKHAGQQAGRRKGASQSADQRYGESAAQLSRLPEGRAPQAAIASPPFENGCEGVMRANKFKDPVKFAEQQRHKGHGSSLQAKIAAMKRDEQRATYGSTDGNLGNDSGDTFWGASRQILTELFAVLKPGAHTIWILGNFVRKGRVVEFDKQWEALCVEVGFIPVCRHIAHKTEHHGTQALLDGGEHRITTSKISFFRRLSIKRDPSTAITSETVLCLRKPL